MSKLSKLEKQDYKRLLAAYPDAKFVNDWWGAFTLVTVPHDSRLAKETRSFCGQYDVYNKKRGKYEALKHLEKGQFSLVMR